MLGLQYVEYIEILDKNDRELYVGKISSRNSVENEFTLVKEYKGNIVQLGSLRVILGLDQIYSILAKRAITILISNSLKTFIVAGFIFLLVHRTITGPLSNLASKVNDMGSRPDMDIQLNRPPGKADVSDEIDQVVDAINIMNSNLQKELDERINVESNLRKWANIFEIAEWGVVVGSAKDQTLELMNPAYAKMHGYTVDELTGRKALDLYRPEDKAELFKNLSIAREKGYHTFEVKRLRKDGSTFPSLNSFSAIKDDDGETIYYAVNVLDITERKHAEETLKRSENSLKKAQEIGHIGSWKLEIEKGILTWSEEEYKIFGHTTQSFGATYEAFLEAVHPDDRDMVDRTYTEAIKNKTPYECVHRILRPDGEIRTVLERSEDFIDENGKTKHSIGITLDITEQKRVEGILRISENLLKKAQEIGHIGSWHLDIENNALSWSDEQHRIFGHTPQSFAATYEAFIEAVHPDDREMVNRTYTEAIKNKTPYECVHRVLRPNGEIRTVLERSEDIVDEDGKTIHSIGMTLDITEQKKAEANIQKWTKVFENAEWGVVVLGSKGPTLDLANPAYARMHGYTIDELIGRNAAELYSPEDRDKISENRLIARKKGSHTYEVNRLRKDGSTFPSLNTITAIRDADGEMMYYAVNVLDITERKRAEEKLGANAAISSNLSEGVFLIGMDDLTIKWVNPVFEQMFGYDSGELIGKPVDIVNAPTEMKPEETKISIVKILEETGEWHGEILNIKKDGTHFWSFANVSIFDHSEYGKVMVSVHTDITERKQAEETLRVSENSLRKAQEIGHIGSWHLDIEKNVLTWSDEQYKIFGHTTQSFGETYEAFLEAVHPDDREMVNRTYTEAIKNKTPYECVHRVLRPDGEIRTVLEKSEDIVDENGKTTHSLGMTLDITEQKKAEEDLINARDELNEIFNLVPHIICVAHTSGYYKRANPAMTKVLGYTEDEFTSRPFFDFIHPEDHEKTKNEIEKQKDGNPVIHFENRYRRKDGSYRLFAWKATPANESGNVYATASDITDSRLAEEELRQHEHIVSSTTDMLALLDKHYVYLATNAAYLQAHAKAPDEVIGRTPAEVFGEEFFNKVIRPRAERCMAGEDIRFEDWIDFPATGRRYMDVAYSPYLGPDTKVRGFVVTARDITVRKQAEEELRESKANLAMAQKMARIGSWEYNIVTNKSIWSDETYRLFGFEPHEFEITYKYYLDAILHPKDRERVVEEVNNALEHDDGYDGEYRIITKDGQVLTMHSIAKLDRDSNGNPVRMIVSIQDITKRKQVEEELKKSEERFSVALKDSKTTVFTQDSELIYTWVYNPAPGLTPDFVVGKTDHDLVSSNDAKVLTEMKRRVLETGVAEHGTIRFTIEGVPSYHDLNVEPLRDGNEHIVGVIGVSNNITDIKHAEKEIQKLNDELEQRVRERTIQLETANQELESFAYSVSHELRAPLRSMDGFSHAIVKQYSDNMDDEGIDFFSRIRAASQKMAELIDALLELPRLSRAEMSIADVDLSRLARNAVEYLRNSEPGRNVTFRIVDGLITKGDRKFLQAVVVNLMANAWKFTSKKESVQIEFGSEDQNGKTVFYVRDNGAGFNMDYADKLFRPFQRLHSAEEFPGTGVGLASAKRIIDRHGGDIWAEGRVGQGATFFFTLSGG